MFICSICQKVTEPREPMTKVVTERRDKVYSDSSKGWEIVKEIPICLACNKAAKNAN